MKKVLCVFFAVTAVLLLLTGCHAKSSETLTVDVETGDKIVVTLDTSKQLSMRLDDSKIYFTDSIGQEGAYLMFLTDEQVESMNEQFGDGMRQRQIGDYTVQMFYAQLDGVPSAAAYMKTGNTGMCFVSAMSEDVLEQLIPCVTVEVFSEK